MNNDNQNNVPQAPVPQPAGTLTPIPQTPAAKELLPQTKDQSKKGGVSLPKIAMPKLAIPHVVIPHIKIQASYVHLLFTFIKFWIWDSPIALYQYFASLNMAFLELFSLPLFLQTFFKPLKNEYREGLVGFSRAIGMFIKTILIAVDVLLFTILLLAEAVIFVGYLIFPFATAFLLFL